mmetsp:Transcript_30349/g.63492  ORF Transcript_30349/g.63492 Transcript_30349/m.63492 type:complete len:279 (+) Transcript_30349:334-1170(+)
MLHLALWVLLVLWRTLRNFILWRVFLFGTSLTSSYSTLACDWAGRRLHFAVKFQRNGAQSFEVMRCGQRSALKSTTRPPHPPPPAIFSLSAETAPARCSARSAMRTAAGWSTIPSADGRRAGCSRAGSGSASAWSGTSSTRTTSRAAAPSSSSSRPRRSGSSSTTASPSSCSSASSPSTTPSSASTPSATRPPSPRSGGCWSSGGGPRRGCAASTPPAPASTRRWSARTETGRTSRGTGAGGWRTRPRSSRRASAPSARWCCSGRRRGRGPCRRPSRG